MKARLLAAACCVLLIAGCGGKKDKADQRTASGEVLQGTISDDMLPLATVTSQPPKAAPRPAASATDSAGDEDAADAADDTIDDAAPATGSDEGD